SGVAGLPSPQLMTTAVGVSVPGSVYPLTVRVNGEPSAGDPLPASVTVGATLVTFTAFVPAVGKVPSSSTTVTVIVWVAGPSGYRWLRATDPPPRSVA